MLVLEIAAGIVLGLIVFKWISATYNSWANEYAMKQAEHIRDLVANRMIQEDLTIQQDQNEDKKTPYL